MFKDMISVDMGNKFIKIMVGNKKRIFKAESIAVPQHSPNDETAGDMEAAYKIIKNFIERNNVLTKDICFMIHGSDIIIRHVDIPIMSYSKMKENVIWEISQYLPELGKNHYIDYEIVDKIVTKEKKIYKVMVVAAPKYTVDNLVRFSKKLGLNLKYIDISANCVARVFKRMYMLNKNLRSIGIIDVGSRSSRIIILDKGDLFFEREVDFGISDIVNEISAFFNKNKKESYDYFINNFSLNDKRQQNDMQKRIKDMLDNAISNFQRVIAFYNSGKSNKKLNQIYLIGAGAEIYGIEKYVQNIMGTEVRSIKSADELNTKCSFPVNLNFCYYVNTFGMFLKDKPDSLNLLPENMKKTKEYIYNRKIASIVLAASLAVILIIVLIPKIYLFTLNRNKADLENEIHLSKSIETKNKNLKSDKKKYSGYIEKVELLKNRNELLKKVQDLSKYKPQDVKLISTIFTDDSCTIEGNTASYNSIAQFDAKLQMSDEYRNARIEGIKNDKSQYDFNIVIKESSK